MSIIRFIITSKIAIRSMDIKRLVVYHFCILFIKLNNVEYNFVLSSHGYLDTNRTFILLNLRCDYVVLIIYVLFESLYDMSQLLSHARHCISADTVN